MDFHPIRNSMARLCATIFEFALGPLCNIGNIVVETVTSASGGGEGALSSMSANLQTAATDIGNSLRSTGLALCFLFFLIALIELAMSERMTLEYFVKFFSKLVIGVAAVYFWEEIYTVCKDIGPELATKIGNYHKYGGAAEAATVDFHAPFLNYVAEAGGSSWLILLLASFILGAPLLLFSFAVIGVVYVICFTWILEVSIRGMFLPIACALISDDGWRGAGGRYIRRFLATCCQGAVIVAISKLSLESMHPFITEIATAAQNFDSGGGNSGFFNTFGISLKGENLDFMWTIATNAIVLIGVAVATVSVMFKSSSIVNDVFGG